MDFNKKIDAAYKIAESSDEAYARLKKGMDEIIAENPGCAVMLVAYGQSISFLLAAIGGEVSTPLVYDYALKTYSIEGPAGDMSYAEAGAKI